MASHGKGGGGGGAEAEAHHDVKETEGSPPHYSQVDILEKGEIFFFYRPKVETERPTSMDDVQRMYIVLKPERSKAKEEVKQSHESGKEGVKQESTGGDTKFKTSFEHHAGRKRQADDDGKASEHDGKHADKKEELDASPDNKGKHGGEGEEKVNIEKQDLFRFIVTGRKRLPDPSKRERPYWCFVDLVTTNLEDIKQALGPEQYETKTRGERLKPAVRPAGEGRYCIVKHNKGKQFHTHLINRLELPTPDKPRSPQTELHIKEEGSFIIQVKNPNQPAPANVGLGNKRKATYPAHLQSNMGHYRFVAADPVDYLNYEGCEFILISASDDVEKELGLHLDVQHDERCSALLSLSGKNEPLNVKPLLEGEWA